MERKEIIKKLDRIDGLPTLTAIAIEVNKMLQNYNTSITKLSGTIVKDQAMVVKILKLVNSAFFGLRSKVSNIPNAVVLLGFNTVRNAVVTVSIMDAFKTKEVSNGFAIADFWKHSVAVAVTSKYLAEKTRLHEPDDCFIGGLLHDMRKVILAQHFEDSFKNILKSIEEENLSFYAAEKSEISFGHASIGGHLAEKWQLPTGLLDAIRHHHTLSKSATDQDLLMIVHAADIIVNSYVADSQCPLELSEMHPDAVELIRDPLDTVSDWYPKLTEEIESACEFFLRS